MFKNIPKLSNRLYALKLCDPEHFNSRQEYKVTGSSLRAVVEILRILEENEKALYKIDDILKFVKVED